MTVPEQMNCPHTGEGWCLNCVNNLSKCINTIDTELKGGIYDCSEKFNPYDEWCRGWRACAEKVIEMIEKSKNEAQL